MSRFKSYGLYIIIVTGLIVLATVIITVLSFITQGANTNFNQILLNVLATLTGGLLAALLSLVTYYNINQSSRVRKLQKQLLESYEQQQKEELVRLSQQESELEKQRTELEKLQQTLMWQLAAAESMKDDPRLAIVVAYQGLESEIQSLISRVYRIDTEDTKQGFSTSYDFDMLADYINFDEAVVIMQMRDLRNRIVHGEVSPEELTEDKVRDYVQSAGRIARDILQVGQLPEA